MDLEATKRELTIAYSKLEAAEIAVSDLRKEKNDNYKINQILIAAGFLTQEKIDEARDILQGFDT